MDQGDFRNSDLDWGESLYNCINKCAKYRIIADSYGIHKDPCQQVVRRYTLINPSGLTVQVINFGATLTAVYFPDRLGRTKDVLLGYQKLDGYRCNQSIGSTTGRFSGIIESGRYIFHSKPVQLSTNVFKRTAGGVRWHHANGGLRGFDKVVWDSYKTKDKVVMTHISRHGYEGYPGEFIVQVTFRLTPEDSLVIETDARTSHPTPVSISHHPYFNLVHHGMGAQGLKEHIIILNADKYVDVDCKTGIPTGKLNNVTMTGFDLRVPSLMSNIIRNAPDGGFNITYCLPKDHHKDDIIFAARVYHPPTGRMLDILTNQPAIHLDTTGRSLINSVLLKEEVESMEMLAKREKYDNECKFCKVKDVKSDWEENYYENCPRNEIRGNAKVCDSWVDLRWGEDNGEEMEDGFEDAECWSDDDDVVAAESSQWPKQEPEIVTGKQGIRYGANCAFCLWPTEYPDSPNQQNFPNPFLLPGEKYSRTVVYKFRVVKTNKEEDLFNDIPSWNPMSDSGKPSPKKAGADSNIRNK